MSAILEQLRDLAGLGARAIMADPGIAFRTRSAKGEGRCPQKKYTCSTFDQLAKLPIAAIAAPDCFLFLWMPKRSVFLAEPLLDAWGWTFSGSAFTWAKLNPRAWADFPNAGLPIWADKFWFMGNGLGGTRQNTECCWLGRRGSPKRLSLGTRELIVAPRREHSRKPDEVYARIEALTGGPYVEIFARQQWPGWISLGDEIDKFQAAPRTSEGLQQERAASC
jgi:N6-adenosine-specific RNA methylase IME4